MHQGKQLKEAANRQKNITLFAKEIGISRDTLYKLYKKQIIPAKYVEKLLSLGVHLTGSDNTKYYSSPGHPLLKLSGSNGVKKHIKESSNISQDRSFTGETLPMNEMIALSLMELLKLQQVTDDSEMTKAISQVIQLKQRIEYLEKEKQTLEKDKEFLTELLKQKK